jgi:hypothetical protein
LFAEAEELFAKKEALALKERKTNAASAGGNIIPFPI